jgi:hypothetical protein
MDFMPDIETISWQPRAQIYHNFFTQEECAQLVEFGMLPQNGWVRLFFV